MVGICFPVALPQAGMMRTFGPGSVAAELGKGVKQIPFGNDRQEKQGQRQVQQQVLRLRYASLRMTIAVAQRWQLLLLSDGNCCCSAMAIVVAAR
jgi:hypothetical protein